MAARPAQPLARRRLLLALLAACGGTAGARAADDASVEYQVKAAFVCKFGNYVEWPAQALGRPGESFRIGVLGDESVLEAFRRTAAAASVAGRPVEAQALAHGGLPEALQGLHAVFIARTMAPQAAAVLAAARGRPILTITELDAGGAPGMINFVVVDDKVRFDIQLPATTQSGLKISARLLGVARRIEGRP